MNRTIAFAAAAAPLVFALAACSGASTAFVGANDDGGTGSDGSTGDGGPPPDGGPAGCPTTAPKSGDPCKTASLSLTCEFGGVGNQRLCSTTATCIKGSSGIEAWVVNPPAPSCVSSSDQNPGACPATFTTRPTGASCPSSAGLSCVYTQGMCGCIPCIGDGGGGGGGQQEWACDPFPSPTGCPVPRPLIGSACTQEGLSCGYGEQCGVVSGPNLGCRAGRWELQPSAAACAIRTCGK